LADTIEAQRKEDQEENLVAVPKVMSDG